MFSFGDGGEVTWRVSIVVKWRHETSVGVAGAIRQFVDCAIASIVVAGGKVSLASGN